MRIDKFFVESWEIYTKHLVPFAIAIIICFVLGILSLGTLFPALFAGFVMMFVKVKRGQEVEYNEIFAYMSKWVYLALVSTVMWIAICLGLIFFILPGLIFFILSGLIFLIFPGLLLITAWMYLIYFIVDKNMSFTQACGASSALVQQKDFWMHLLFILVVGFVVFVPWGIPPVGYLISLLLTAPLAFGAIACAYEEEVKDFRS